MMTLVQGLETDENVNSRSKLTEDRRRTLRVSDAFRTGLAKCSLGAATLTFLLSTTYVAEGLNRPHIALASRI